MKTMSIQTWAKVMACAVLAIGTTISAMGSCGDSFISMAGGKAIVSSSMNKLLSADTANSPAHSSIVGLWYVQFEVQGQTIQEAFQNWNVGGTEVHNPNVDPRAGNVCLGTWIKMPGGSYKLAHRVWSYDTNGNFLGTVHLSETVHLKKGGCAQAGSFTLDFYNPDGSFQMEVAGNVVGQRIQVE